LNLHAILFVAQQVFASQYVLEKAKKDFNRPTIRKYLSNDIRWHVQQVCGDAKNTVAVHSTGTACISTRA